MSTLQPNDEYKALKDAISTLRSAAVDLDSNEALTFVRHAYGYLQQRKIQIERDFMAEYRKGAAA